MVIIQKKIIFIQVFMVVLFFTLNSYYFYFINFPIVQLIGFVILLFLIKSVSISNLKLLLPYITYVTFLSILTPLYISNITSPISLIGFLSCLFIFLYFSSIKILILKYFINAIELLTIILLFFWLVQFFAYYLSGTTIDYFIDIVGYQQRTNFGIFDQGFFRPASLFLEPAMYVNAMFLIFVFRFLIFSRFDLKNLLILFTIVFTMSLYGYVSFFMLLLVIFIHKISIRKLFLILILLIFIGFTVIYFFNDNAIIQRILNPLSNQSGQDRIIGTIYLFLDESPIFLLFGYGIGNGEVNGYSGSGLHFLFYNTGIVGIIFLIGTLMIYSLKTNRPTFFIFIFILSILNNSSSITSFFNWMMLGIILNIMLVNQKKLSVRNSCS